ncbi:hypothetical protein BP5796_00145 [Coleophoma crateriformis]|uniref:Small secreted protein n=1 Tax=Coleophoma crateriformis TaxID=565419 RepID=A0A3D8T709_9HELO|nr:hypothetical protein BP5796_00145 [Coleophoma crateriformis]
MKFSIALVAVLAGFVAASPMPKKAASSSTAAAAAATSTASTSTKAAAGADVLTASDYSAFQISDGTAGTAQAKANALFSAIDMNNLASVSANDLKVIQGIHTVAENAEVKAFNPAIAAASGAAATALQNGKIQNKVLKLTAEVLGIQVKAAQGGSSSSLAAEQAKLKNNIALDTAAAGQASTSVTFSGTS